MSTPSPAFGLLPVAPLPGGSLWGAGLCFSSMCGGLIVWCGCRRWVVHGHRWSAAAGFSCVFRLVTASLARDSALPSPSSCAFACPHDCCRTWSVGVNFTLLDIACSASPDDAVTVYAGATVIFQSCRAANGGAVVVWHDVPQPYPAVATLVVVFKSGVGGTSGIGAGFRAQAVSQLVPATPSAAPSRPSSWVCPGPNVVWVSPPLLAPPVSVRCATRVNDV